ncbi:MAG TPA: MscL family protein [Nocardioides sp.]|nr:MscL family protein [Nocardioides sp.]
MGGFKKFLLQGDLVSLAVAFVMATAFAAVVKAFVTIIMDLIGKTGATTFFNADDTFHGVHIAAFLVALITFVIIAAVVYFFVVVPYTKAKDKFFPTPPSVEGETVESLLGEIRDSLKSRP